METTSHIIKDAFQANFISSSKEEEIYKMLNKKYKLSQFTEADYSPYWTEDSYNLNKSSLFNELSNEKKSILLKDLASERLNEALYIEKCGMVFTAKMSLLASNLEERIMYSSFSEDEARHYLYFNHFIDPSYETNENEFLSLLRETIEEGKKHSLIFIIQILLEGWGLFYYSKLRKDCNNPALKNLITNILIDESDHHNGGLLLFDQESLSHFEKNYIIDTLKVFLYMVQIGDQLSLARMDNVSGGLNRNQKIKFLNEIASFENAQEKLNTLKLMFQKAGTHSLISELEANNYFKAFSVEQSLG